jgi:hypothetical protein
VVGTSSTTTPADGPPEGLLEEIIINGAAFGKPHDHVFKFSTETMRTGYGLFNLILSFLPAKAR